MGTDNVFVAENAMDNLAVNNQTKDIQIVHVHGTYNFYDCANLETEINNIATQSGMISIYQIHRYSINPIRVSQHHHG